MVRHIKLEVLSDNGSPLLNLCGGAVGMVSKQKWDNLVRTTFPDPDSPQLFNYHNLAKYVALKNARQRVTEPVDTEFLLLLVRLRERI
jgi:hypothetical protein